MRFIAMNDDFVADTLKEEKACKILNFTVSYICVLSSFLKTFAAFQFNPHPKIYGKFFSAVLRGVARGEGDQSFYSPEFSDIYFIHDHKIHNTATHTFDMIT